MKRVSFILLSGFIHLYFFLFPFGKVAPGLSFREMHTFVSSLQQRVSFHFHTLSRLQVHFSKRKGIRFSRCMSCSMCKYIPDCHSTSLLRARCCDSPVVSCNARARTHTHVRMYIHVYAYVQYCTAHRSHTLRKKAPKRARPRRSLDHLFSRIRLFRAKNCPTHSVRPYLLAIPRITA